MKASNIFGRNDASIPRPVSVTVASASAPSRPSVMPIAPASGVNLAALSSRLEKTCSRRAASPLTITGSGGRSRVKRSCFACSAGCTVSIACAMTSRRSTGATCRAILPWVTRDTSSRSFTMRVSCAICRCIISSVGFSSRRFPLSIRRRCTALFRAAIGLRSSRARFARLRRFHHRALEELDLARAQPDDARRLVAARRAGERDDGAAQARGDRQR